LNEKGLQLQPFFFDWRDALVFERLAGAAIMDTP